MPSTDPKPGTLALPLTTRRTDALGLFIVDANGERVTLQAACAAVNDSAALLARNAELVAALSKLTDYLPEHWMRLEARAALAAAEGVKP